MLSCSSKQVGQGEMLSQIDFCLPENRVDFVLSVGALNIRVSVSFGGSFSFKQWSQRSVGEARARDAGGIADIAGPALSLSSIEPAPSSRCQAVSPTSGCSRTCRGTRGPAPPGASGTRRLRKLCRFSRLVNPFFLLLSFLCFRLLVILSIVARLSLNNPSPLTPPPTSKDVLLVVVVVRS
jgi:hypothetical protein